MVVVVALGGCRAHNTAAPQALLAVTTPPSIPKFALGYHNGWVAAALERSADGAVSPHYLHCDWLNDSLPGPPDAILSVADYLVVFRGEEVWRVVVADGELGGEKIGTCPAQVRQAIVVAAPETNSGPIVGLLAGGYYENGQLQGASIFLGRLTADRIRFYKTAYQAAWNPWVIRPGRLRNCPVVFIGAAMPTYFDPQCHRRPQVFEVIGNGPPRLRPIWLGTSLSRPFVDATFVDCDGDGESELAAVELAVSGEFLVQLYKWRGSGVEGWAATPACYRAPPEIGTTKLRGDREVLLIKSDNSLSVYSLVWSGTGHGEDQLVPRERVLEEVGMAWVVIPADADDPGYIACLRANGDLDIQELP